MKFMTLNDPQAALKQAYIHMESKAKASSWPLRHEFILDPKGAHFPVYTALTAVIWELQFDLANEGVFQLMECLK